MCKIEEGSESPNEGGGGGVFQLDVEPESPNEGPACVRCMMNRNRQM